MSGKPRKPKSRPALKAKNGRDYEEFNFETFAAYFPKPEFDVKLDDSIWGHDSAKNRQIDVSIRFRREDTDVLYIVQAKDHKRPIDLVRIGEFSSVIRDVRAQKGILVCSKGFAKSVHTYARNLGIELLSIEDINSSKWNAIVEIPVIHVDYEFQLELDFVIDSTPELVEANKNKPITLTGLIIDGQEMPPLDIADFIFKNFVFELGRKEIRCLENVSANWSGLVVPVREFQLSAVPMLKERRLKYFTPNEYRVIRDHLRDTALPIKMNLKTVPLVPDDTWIVIQGEDPVAAKGISIEIHKNLSLGALKEGSVHWSAEISETK